MQLCHLAYKISAEMICCFLHFLCLLLTCWHLGKGENAIHIVSCHQERTKTVCLFVLFVFGWMSLRVVKRVHWCIFIFNKWISTSWVVEDTRLCLSNIVAFAQSRHKELSPKTHITIHIFILWIVISLSILNSWKVFLNIVLQVGNVIDIFKTSLCGRGRPHGDQRFVRFSKTQTTGGNQNGPTMP